MSLLESLEFVSLSANIEENLCRPYGANQQLPPEVQPFQVWEPVQAGDWLDEVVVQEQPGQVPKVLARTTGLGS